jgi:putative ABC transport system permease protein
VVDLALKTLLHDKTRFLITVSGVAFAVALIMVQVGLFLGLLDNASVTIEKMDAELWVTSKATPNVDFAHAFPETRVERVRSVPGVERADNLIVGFMNVQLPSGAEEGMLVYALDDFAKWGVPWDVAEGDLADLPRGKYMFLDESAEKRYGAFAVGEYREVLGQRLKIIGRTRGAKSFTTTPIGFLDFDLAQRLSPQLMRGNTTYVLVKVSPGANVEDVRKEIQARLPHNDVFTREEWASASRGYWIRSTGIGFTMFMTVFLGTLVGIVIVAQTLYTQTMEHIKEFGTVKAIGGSNRDIYRILARQAGVAAVVGFALGALPSLGVRSLVATAGLQIILTPGFGAAVFLGTIVMCLLAAIFSFRKVASIDPGLVFRT